MRPRIKSACSATLGIHHRLCHARPGEALARPTRCAGFNAGRRRPARARRMRSIGRPNASRADFVGRRTFCPHGGRERRPASRVDNRPRVMRCRSPSRSVPGAKVLLTARPEGHHFMPARRLRRQRASGLRSPIAPFSARWSHYIVASAIANGAPRARADDFQIGQGGSLSRAPEKCVGCRGRGACRPRRRGADRESPVFPKICMPWAPAVD